MKSEREYCQIIRKKQGTYSLSLSDCVFCFSNDIDRSFKSKWKNIRIKTLPKYQHLEKN